MAEDIPVIAYQFKRDDTSVLKAKLFVRSDLYDWINAFAENTYLNDIRIGIMCVHNVRVGYFAPHPSPYNHILLNNTARGKELDLVQTLSSNELESLNADWESIVKLFVILKREFLEDTTSFVDQLENVDQWSII